MDDELGSVAQARTRGLNTTTVQLDQVGTRASPIPKPPSERLVESFTWVNRSKILGSMAGSMPMPVSLHSGMAWSPFASTVSSMRLPSCRILGAVVQQVRDHLRQSA